MHRQTNTSRAAHTIDLTHLSQPQSLLSPRRIMDGTTHLPLYNRISGDGKREIPSSRRAEKLVHLIPLVLLLCLFILWWFSYPVELEIKDGRITAVYQVITQNIPFLHLTNLPTVSAPYPIISDMLIMNNGTVAEPASSVLER